MVSCECCERFKNSFFYRTSPAAALDLAKIQRFKGSKRITLKKAESRCIVSGNDSCSREMNFCHFTQFIWVILLKRLNHYLIDLDLIFPLKRIEVKN